MGIFIALGSNIGDRLAYLGKGILLLSQHPDVKIKALSSIYETDPVGYADQDNFYNMVIEIETNLSAQEMIDVCLAIESCLGRQREIVNGPRTLDLDLLFYHDEVLADPMYTVPHPRLHERAFVLIPLAEIASHFRHPVLHDSVDTLLAKVNQAGVTMVDIKRDSC